MMINTAIIGSYFAAVAIAANTIVIPNWRCTRILSVVHIDTLPVYVRCMALWFATLLLLSVVLIRIAVAVCRCMQIVIVSSILF